ncbi:putative SP-containing protein [Vairimorpha necatrix]|uniref:SP-containing protein n=1 Tax=Vairimorpha necatrix TaxID=6039 RepID=A0AAX4JF62_9MICR
MKFIFLFQILTFSCINTVTLLTVKKSSTETLLYLGIIGNVRKIRHYKFDLHENSTETSMKLLNIYKFQSFDDTDTEIINDEYIKYNQTCIGDILKKKFFDSKRILKTVINVERDKIYRIRRYVNNDELGVYTDTFTMNFSEEFYNIKMSENGLVNNHLEVLEY